MMFDTVTSWSGRAQKQSKHFFCINHHYIETTFSFGPSSGNIRPSESIVTYLMLVDPRKNSLWKSNIPRLESAALEVKMIIKIIYSYWFIFLIFKMGILLTLQDNGKDYTRLGLWDFLAHATYSRHSNVSSNFPILILNQIKNKHTNKTTKTNLDLRII